MFNKRICIITSVHPVFDVRIFHKEAKTLVKSGYNVILIAQQDNRQPIINNRQQLTITVNGVKIIFLPKPKNRFFRIFFLARKAYKLALRQKADVYHFHDPELLPWMLRLKKKTGAKIIYDIHEDVPKQILSKYWMPRISRRPIAGIFNFFEKRVAEKLDYIITATQGIKSNFKQPNVIDIRNYPIINLKSIENREIYKSKNCYTLIYAGGLEEIRGIQEIIQSLKFINPKYNIELELVGEFSDKNFENKLQKLKEWKKVQYLGQLSHNQVLKHLAEMDIGLVCLYPLERFLTSLPIKMFEYMAAGLPIIASNFSLWKKIIEENNCGITVNSLSPKEIGKAVEYLIEHPEKAKEMGKNGRKAVLEKYNWENEEKKLLKVYGELCTK